MIEIDGSYGEGGGQVLRTSLSLAALLGEPVVICSIRAGRPKPGLAAQHVTCVRAVAAICNAEVDGDEVGSGAVTIYPGAVRPGEYRFDVGDVKASAGSACLILQTILPPLLYAGGPSRVRIVGGTHVPWSPTADYITYTFLPAIRALGAQAQMHALRGGWYPRGGGEIEAQIEPLAGALQPCDFTRRGETRKITLVSTVSEGLPEHILPRQIRGLREAVGAGGQRAGEISRRIEGGPGTAALVAAEFEGGFAGYSALGERGKPAEKVGAEAGGAFAEFRGTAACVDEHLADQIALYMALAAGRSKVLATEVTMHLHTNMWVISRFLGARFEVTETSGGVLVEVAGAGA